MKEAVYSIKDLETLSGVKAHTIRIWEKRYNLLTPDRTNTNIRYYCDEDLRRLLNIALLLKHGNKISKVAGLTCNQIKDKIIAMESNDLTESYYIERLIIHMVNFDDESFLQLFDEIINKLGIEKAMLDIIFPFFEKIGMYWQVGSVFPAQEHYVSNLVRQKLIVEIDKLYVKHTKNKTILFFLHENEMHEIGLLLYALMALRRGFKIIYLGQFIPLSDLFNLKDKCEVGYIFTQFINSIGEKELQDYLSELGKEFSNKKIFITGRQIEKYNPNLPGNTIAVKSLIDFNKYFGEAIY